MKPQGPPMQCFSLLLGSRNAPAAGARFRHKDEATIQRITAKHFPSGSTIIAAEGNWYDPRLRKYVREESRQILVCAAKKEDLTSWYNELCDAMQQQTLMLVELGPAHVIQADPVKRQAAAT